MLIQVSFFFWLTSMPLCPVYLVVFFFPTRYMKGLPCSHFYCLFLSSPNSIILLSSRIVNHLLCASLLKFCTLFFFQILYILHFCSVSFSWKVRGIHVSLECHLNPNIVQILYRKHKSDNIILAYLLNWSLHNLWEMNTQLP